MEIESRASSRSSISGCERSIEQLDTCPGRLIAYIVASNHRTSDLCDRDIEGWQLRAMTAKAASIACYAAQPATVSCGAQHALSSGEYLQVSNYQVDLDDE